MSGTNPPIITDGPAKIAALGTATGTGTALGATYASMSWMIVLGVLLALLGVTTTAFGTLRRRRTDWKK